MQVSDRFYDQDSLEWRRMKNEVKVLARKSRDFQLKLKKSEIRTAKLQAENAQLTEAVTKNLKKRQGSAPRQMGMEASGSEAWKSAAIWAAVLVAGYQLLKVKG